MISSTSTGRVLSYLPLIVIRFIFLILFMKSFRSIAQQLRLATLLKKGMRTIIPIGFYVSWVDFREAMVLAFGKGGALYVGKVLKVAFHLLFSGIGSPFQLGLPQLALRLGNGLHYDLEFGGNYNAH